MQHVTIVSSKVLVNGGKVAVINPSRGLRQRDQFFPYLFILCQEVLSRMLESEFIEGRMARLKLSFRGPCFQSYHVCKWHHFMERRRRRRPNLAPRPPLQPSTTTIQFTTTNQEKKKKKRTTQPPTLPPKTHPKPNSKSTQTKIKSKSNLMENPYEKLKEKPLDLPSLPPDLPLLPLCMSVWVWYLREREREMWRRVK